MYKWNRRKLVQTTEMRVGWSNLKGAMVWSRPSSLEESLLKSISLSHKNQLKVNG